MGAITCEFSDLRLWKDRVMRLPNPDTAIVEEGKILEYLLNPEHPCNGGKAGFFFALGFRRETPQALAGALRELAVGGSVVKNVETPHGRKYIVDGRIATPSGRKAGLRTVWIVDRGSESPRLVTAYPLEGQNHD